MRAPPEPPPFGTLAHSSALKSGPCVVSTLESDSFGVELRGAPRQTARHPEAAVGAADAPKQLLRRTQSQAPMCSPAPSAFSDTRGWSTQVRARERAAPQSVSEHRPSVWHRFAWCWPSRLAPNRRPRRLDGVAGTRFHVTGALDKVRLHLGFVSNAPAVGHPQVKSLLRR